MDRQRFIELRNRYLTSAQPVQSPEYLKGREAALSNLIDALTSPGRHAFIYGFRVVGKTSLAHTAAYQLQAAIGSPILASCDPSSTFATTITAIVREAIGVNPLERKGQTKLQLGGSIAGTGANLALDRQTDRLNVRIETVADAIEVFRAILSQRSSGLIIVIDEFDQIRERSEHQKFAALVKQLSDRHVNIRIIFCGIADSVDALFAEHESIFRQMHSEKVDRLPLQPRIDIIESASQALEIEISATHKYRIAQISDGFPSFVHLLSEKVFTACYYSGLGTTDQSSYETGVSLAIDSVEVTLKKKYEDALHKNTKKYEHTIWSVAADKLLDCNVDTAWNHYLEICLQLRIDPVSKNNFNTKLTQLCKEEYGSILLRPRRSNYSFSEKMMRAYARLRAERFGCQLGNETP